MEIMPNIPNVNRFENTVKELEKSPLNDKRLKEEERLKEVCEDFEAIFVNMMLKSGRSTVDEGGLVEKSAGTKMFEGMYDEELSSIISKTDDGGMGIGIGKLLYEQMKMSLSQPRREVLEPKPDTETEVTEAEENTIE